MNPADPTALHDEQLAALLAAPPPRIVPAALQRTALRQAAPMIMGIFGAGVFLVGLFFTALFFPRHFDLDWQLRAADTAEARGRITQVAPTNLRINRARVMRYGFEFHPPGGALVAGDCYTTGTPWRVNSTVSVRYRPENPQVACPVGARLSEGNLTSMIVLIFPLCGVGLIAWVVVSRRRTRALLKDGLVAEAQVTAVEMTRSRVNNQYVHEITLQRTDGLGDATFTISRYQPAVIALAKQRLETKQPVFVLYDPARPKRVLLPEAL